MPEVSNSFQAGKMNKDADERLVSPGEYREALNIEVTTSEGSNVGTAQTVLGNVRITGCDVSVGDGGFRPNDDPCKPGDIGHEREAVSYTGYQSASVGGCSCLDNSQVHYTVGHIVDEKVDRIIRLVASPASENGGVGIDRIIEYNTDPKAASAEVPVFVDVYRAKATTTGAGTVGVDILTVNIDTSIYVRPGMNISIAAASGVVRSGYTEADNLFVKSITGSTVVIQYESGNPHTFPSTIVSGDIITFKAERVLNFDDPSAGFGGIAKKVSITGINIINDLLFWTDNYSEPKKIHIPRSKMGTINYCTHTDLFVKNIALPTKVENKGFIKHGHVTVIRKGPTMPPTLEIWNTPRVDNTLGTGTELPDVTACQTNIMMATYSNGSNKMWTSADTPFMFSENVSSPVTTYQLGDVLRFEHVYESASTGEFITALVTGQVVSNYLGGNTTTSPGSYEVQITSITPNQPLEPANPTIANYFVYDVTLMQKSAMWEFKFPRFSYRYKYSDGEYSPFGPFSEVAFVPGKFDYLPKKGYNLGMVNRLRYLEVSDWVPKDIPQDVIQVDILYKETSSPNVYTVESFKKDDPIKTGMADNEWNRKGTIGTATAGHAHSGSMQVTSDLIHKTVPANQLLRPWDNVPRLAMAQEMIGNRIVYANYLQNYNLTTDSNLDINKPEFIVSTTSVPAVLGNEGLPGKSLKSMRNYQIGVVYRDEFGRETPVLTSTSGTVKLPKSFATLMNRFDVKIVTPPPTWAKTFKFFVKETSNEYYNLAMDRYYTAKDGNVWLSFPSSERNKVTEETFIILKKQHDNHVFVDDEARYKIIAIESRAPEFIRTENRSWGSLAPYPSFVDSGSPYPGRQNIDIAWDIWKRSAFQNMDSSSNNGIEVRVRTPLNTFNSGWYEITNMGTVDLGPSEVMRLTSKDVFGDDMLFTSQDGGVSMISNLVLDVREKKVVNRAQFDGRFFVKIYKDDVLMKNLAIEGVRDDADLVPVMSKRISYMDYCSPGEDNDGMWDKWNGYGNDGVTPVTANVTDDTIGSTSKWNQGNQLSNNSTDGPVGNWGSALGRAVPWAIEPGGGINPALTYGTNYAARYSVPRLPGTAWASSVGDGFDTNVLRYMKGTGTGNGCRSQNCTGTGAPDEFYEDIFFKDNDDYDTNGENAKYIASQPLTTPRGSRWNTQFHQNSPGPWVSVWTDEANGDQLHVNDPPWMPGIKTNGPWGGCGPSHPRGTAYGPTTWGSNFAGHSITTHKNPVGGMLRKYWNSTTGAGCTTATGPEPAGSANPRYPHSISQIGASKAAAYNGGAGHVYDGVTYGAGITATSTENALFNVEVALMNAMWANGDRWPRAVSSGGLGGTKIWYDSNPDFTGWMEGFWGLGTYAIWTGLKGNRPYNSGASVVKDLAGFSSWAYGGHYGDTIVGLTGFWRKYYLGHQWVNSKNPADTSLYPYPYCGENTGSSDNAANALIDSLGVPTHNAFVASGHYGLKNWETWNAGGSYLFPMGYDTAVGAATDAFPYGLPAAVTPLHGSDYSDEKYPPTGNHWVEGSSTPGITNVVSTILGSYSIGGNYLEAPDEEVPYHHVEGQYPLTFPRVSDAHPTKSWWDAWYTADNPTFWSIRKCTEDPDYYQGYEKTPEDDPSKRWIIDKVGAAQDKCGGGLYRNSTTQVQMLDISFIGIGNGRKGNTIWNLSETPTELGFADAISTPGTRFRFKEDHNGTVYTITNSFLNTDGDAGFIDPETGLAVYAADPDKENPRILNFESDPSSANYDLRHNRRIRWRLSLDKKIGDSANNTPPYYNPISSAVDPRLIDQRGSSVDNPNFNPFGRTTGAIGSAYARVNTDIKVGPTNPSVVGNIITLNAEYLYISKGLTLIKDSANASNIQTIPASTISSSLPLGTYKNVKETHNIKVISRSWVDSAGEPQYLSEQDEEDGTVNGAWNGTNVSTIVELSQAIKYKVHTSTGGSNSSPQFGVGQHELMVYEFPSIGQPYNYSTGTIDEPVTGSATNRQYFDSGWQTWTSNRASRRAKFWHSTQGGVPNGDWNDPTKTTHGTTLNADYAGYNGLNEWGLNYQTIEILQTFDDGGNETDLPMSSNPAIWETEPREDVGMDLYHEASRAYPVKLEENNSEEYIRVGDNVVGTGITVGTRVLSVNGNVVTLDTAQGGAITSGTIVKFTNFMHPLNTTLGDKYTNYAVAKTTLSVTDKIELEKNVHSEKRTLKYFNCYSFGNGVESNRMRDDYNAVTIDKGVKVSMPLATPYEEERRSSGLIFSGIYNSTSGVNETNQFIQAEPITKDLNPVNGEIKKIFARDTDLVTFCEDKVFKIQANKDALFNAGGNHQLTASNKVLGQAISFRGEWGMSHRESFAADSYRVYFVDANRKAVLRLSQDGMTPISNHGMKDYFFDNLKKYTKFIGSHDDRKGTYNLSLQESWNLDPKTISFSEQDRGWSSFKSFIPEAGCSFNDNYYTFNNGQIWRHHDEAKAVSVSSASSTTNVISLTVLPSNVRVGMNVVGDGINDGAIISSISGLDITISLVCNINAGTRINFSAPRNNFYDIQYESSIVMLFNQGPDIVKGFATLKYEGTQARVTLDAPSTVAELSAGLSYESHDGSKPPSTVGQYYNNIVKHGWYVNSIKTDMQEGQAMEFKNKENKWFNYIHGAKRDVHGSGGVKTQGKFMDTSEFSLQGIDYGSSEVTTLARALTLLVNIKDCCGEDLGVSNNVHEHGNVANINGITTNQVTGDTPNGLQIASPKSFIANPDVGYFVAADTFSLCEGTFVKRDGFWHVGGGTWTGYDKVDYVVFSDTSTPWAPDNNVKIDVHLKPGYSFPASSDEILPQIDGKALINPPTGGVTFDTIIRNCDKNPPPPPPPPPAGCESGIDLVFVLDYTGSMGGSIDDIKVGMGDIVNAVIAECTDASGNVADYKIGLVTADEWPCLGCCNTGSFANNVSWGGVVQEGGNESGFLPPTTTCVDGAGATWDVGYSNDGHRESYGNGNWPLYENLPVGQKYVGSKFTTPRVGTGCFSGSYQNQNIKTEVVITAWSLMQRNNLSDSQTWINRLNSAAPHTPGAPQSNYATTLPLGYGANAAEPTDVAIDKVIDGFGGTWSAPNTAKRYIVLFTDAAPSGEGDTLVQDEFSQADADNLDVLSTKLQANGISLIVIGGGVNFTYTPPGGSLYHPWEKIATETGGASEDVDDGDTWSSAVISNLQTLCD